METSSETSHRGDAQLRGTTLIISFRNPLKLFYLLNGAFQTKLYILDIEKHKEKNIHLLF